MPRIINLSLFVLIIGIKLSPTDGYKYFNNETERCLTAESPKDEAKRCYYHYDEKVLRERKTEYPIHPMILGRASHYEQTGEPLTDEELFPLFEAMRWAPSSFNNQPWRVVYAHRGSQQFNEIFNLYVPGNQAWNQNTSVLMIVVTDMWAKYKGKDIFHLSNGLSTGIAMSLLQFEGTARGYLVHIATGIEKEKTAKYLGIEGNPHFEVEFIVSIGKREPASKRIKRKKEDKTTQRKSINDIVSKDDFKNEWRY